MGLIDDNLGKMNISLPDAPAPAANYVQFMIVGDLVHISGQISRTGSDLIIGRLGDNMDVAQGIQAARTCAIGLLTQLKSACQGDLDRLQKVVKLNGFVNSTSDFCEQHLVINGASDLMAEAFAEKGQHSRSAVGVASLPLGVAVEIDGLFQIR